MKDGPLYLDTDIIIALVRPTDRLKVSAERWLGSKREQGVTFVASSVAALELWFYCYKHGLQDESLEAVRALSKMCVVLPIDIEDIQAGLVVAQELELSPADAIHAVIGLRYGGIVSSDHAFNKVPGLKRIDFTKD